MELLNVGIADIWMRSSGIDLRFHIATVLGISMDDWNILASLGYLTQEAVFCRKKCGKMLQ